MDPLEGYNFPIRGLKDGDSRVEYHLESAFFNLFEGNPIKEGKFDVIVDVQKKPTIIELYFQINGSVKDNCDVCLEQIEIPVNGDFRLIGKFHAEQGILDEDVVLLNNEQAFLNLAQYLYEYSCLSLPVVNRIDCKSMNPMPCSKEMLSFLNKEEVEKSKKSGTWEALKDLKLEE